jgi:hypothetical protein
LYDYFEGSLIQFAAEVNNLEDSSIKLDKDIVTVSEAYKLLNSKMINTEVLSSHIEPFVRSSIALIEESTNSNVVYFVDRDFYFRKYDLKYFASGNITEVYHTKLNTDYVNQNCQDLI